MIVMMKIFSVSRAVSLLLVVSALAGRAEERPNFILLMGDDHGWSETGYNGHPYLHTPVLDEMAASGLRLDRFYAAHPTCSPTRGSVLTGRHPNRYGTFSPGWSIRPEEITVASLLSSAGYRCGHFGKWHVGPVKSSSPTNPSKMGFDHYVSHDNFYEMNPSLSRNGTDPEVFPGEGSEVTIAETIRFIDEGLASGEGPFLAVVWFGSPHEPYSALDEDLALYDNLPEELADREVRLTSMETGRPTTRPLRAVLRERYAEITAMDRAIGQLRDYLSEKGLRDNTLLWYCGDNGNPHSSGRVATPLRAEKGFVYESGIRVPGVVEWPAGLKEPRFSGVPAVTSDMLPTLCDLAGKPVPDRPLDGISLVTLFSGEMEERKQPICFWQFDWQTVRKANPELKPWIAPELQEGTTPLVKYMGDKLTRNFQNFHHPQVDEAQFRGARTIIEGRYKLVIGGERGAPEAVELFDLVEDQGEEVNLASGRPNVAQSLKKQLRSWQESVMESLSGADYRGQ